ncbi:hypothetical protein BV898_15575 [Hypsibius exemplaris]|uniref:Uncharacterized protein n=1 Tax=Hypsibius exemplaris TaxID=2072580 RepID=A0A9X6NBC5_HYPEX|nr:hypothetical protein BV898_15575 [Hypsibius exemplaris]
MICFNRSFAVAVCLILTCDIFAISLANPIGMDNTSPVVLDGQSGSSVFDRIFTSDDGGGAAGGGQEMMEKQKRFAQPAAETSEDLVRYQENQNAAGRPQGRWYLGKRTKNPWYLGKRGASSKPGIWYLG